MLRLIISNSDDETRHDCHCWKALMWIREAPNFFSILSTSSGREGESAIANERELKSNSNGYEKVTSKYKFALS